MMARNAKANLTRLPCLINCSRHSCVIDGYQVANDDGLFNLTLFSLEVISLSETFRQKIIQITTNS